MPTNTIPLHVVLMVVVVIITIECKTSPVESTDENQLLLHDSFETDHTPTLAGWRYGDPSLAQLVNEAPPEGGDWCLQLTSDWVPTLGFVYRPVENVESGDIVRLSAYVRGAGTYGGIGIIALATGPDYDANHVKITSGRDTVWQQISVMDTLELEADDSLWVILSSPPTEVIQYRQLFDLVQLEKITP